MAAHEAPARPERPGRSLLLGAVAYCGAMGDDRAVTLLVALSWAEEADRELRHYSRLALEAAEKQRVASAQVKKALLLMEGRRV